MRRLRLALSIVAVLACLPYLALKVAWLAGSRVGLLDPEFGRSAAMATANTVTAAFELVALALAVAFVAPWGRRLPGGLVLLPMWVGSGLLGGVLVALPATAVAAALGPAPSRPPGDPGAGGTPPPTPPLADWVYALVYGGFAVLGLALLAGFALYAHERWLAPAGWSAPLADRPGARRGVRFLALAAALALLVVAPLVLAPLTGLPRGGKDAADAFLAVLAAAGLLALVLRRPAGMRGTVPTLAAWVGTGVVFAWGAYALVLALVPNDLFPRAYATPAFVAIEAVRVAAGLLGGAALLALRPAREPRTS